MTNSFLSCKNNNMAYDGQAMERDRESAVMILTKFLLNVLCILREWLKSENYTNCTKTNKIINTAAYTYWDRVIHNVPDKVNQAMSRIILLTVK